MSTRLLNASPRFPPVKTRNPAVERRWPQSAVVVLFPLVPVMPKIGSEMKREASSTSPINSIRRERASMKMGSESGTPGLATTRSIPRKDSGATRLSSPSNGSSLSSAAGSSGESGLLNDIKSADTPNAPGTAPGS